MKILAISYLFPNALFPAYGVFVLNRLKAVARYAEVVVINPVPWFPLYPCFARYRDYARIPARETIAGLDVWHPRFLSIPKILKGIETRTYADAVRRTFAALGPAAHFDLVDLHWTFPDLPAGRALAHRLGVPVLATLRGVEAFHEQDGDSRERVVARHLGQVDGIVALSQPLLDKAVAKGCTAPGRVIRNGVDADAFFHRPRAQARQRLGLSEAGPMILAVGSLIRVKGFDLLIQALPALVARFGAGLRLRIIGGGGHAGDWGTALRAEVNRLGMAEHVAFMGPVANHDLVDWYNAADVFCLPSRSEGSPNVLTEALACGCPCVATDVGAVREIMDSIGEAGRCVPPENVGALGAALAESLASPGRREDQAARMKQYDWDWCARQVMSMYRDVLSRSRQEAGHG